MCPETQDNLPDSARKDCPVDIYDYFIRDCLDELAKMPLESQLGEIHPLRIAILDYCGMASKYHWKFRDCDIYLMDGKEDACDAVSHYDVVYALVYELQPVFLTFPCIRVVCSRNRISRTELSDSKLK